MKPARTSSLCDTTCASAGASLSVGRNSWLARATVAGMAERYTARTRSSFENGHGGAMAAAPPSSTARSHLWQDLGPVVPSRRDPGHRIHAGVANRADLGLHRRRQQVGLQRAGAAG